MVNKPTRFDGGRFSGSRLFKIILPICLMACFVLFGAARIHARNFVDCYIAETAVSSGDPGRHLDLKVEFDRTIHIAHWDEGARTLRLTQRVNQNWNTTDFVTDVDVDDLALDLGPGGSPYVSYVDHANGGVMWVDPALGSSSAVLVNPSGPVATRVAMVCDDWGRVKVLFYAPVDGGVWLVERIAGVWHPPTRLGDANAQGDLTMDGSGIPWVVFYRSQEVVVLRRVGSTWFEDLVQQGFTGLGGKPSIMLDNSGNPNVAWSSHDAVYRSVRNSSWSHEYLGRFDVSTYPKLSIHQEPRKNDINVTLMQEQTGTFVVANRLGANAWDQRVFAADGNPILDAASATHPITGLVLAFRRGNSIEVQHQEIVPTVSGYFSPNPAVGGEMATLQYSIQCADRLEIDGQLLESGSLGEGSTSAAGLSEGTHTLTVSNGFATAESQVELTFKPFGISRFEALPAVVPKGDQVLLNWIVEGADLIRIEPGGWTSTASIGSHGYYPVEDTTYELFATNTGFGDTSLTTMVETVVIGALEFTASDSLVPLGHPVTFTWLAEGADQIRIEPGGFSSDQFAGSLVVYPLADTIYTLTAENTGFGSMTATVPVDTELFLDFSFVAADSLISRHETTKLSWTALGADTITIEPGGFSSSSPTGYWTVSPLDTTTYTFTAVNEGFGEQSAQATVAVEPFLITSFRADPPGFFEGEPVVLSWEVDGTANVTLVGFGSQPNVGSLTVYPESDAQYTLEAEWNGSFDQRLLTVPFYPPLALEFSFNQGNIDRDNSHVVAGVPFDVFIHWIGPSQSTKILEFGLDPGSPDILVVSSAVIHNQTRNLGTMIDWKIYGFNSLCFSLPANTALARVTLLAVSPEALAGAQMSFRPVSAGTVAMSPGFRNCDLSDESLVSGLPLSLDSRVSGVALPRGRTSTISSIHPNPFNPRTNISLVLQGTGQPRLEIYDMAGRHIRSLEVPEGLKGEVTLQWDGQDKNGREASSGVYLFRLEEAGTAHARRAVLLR